MIQQLIDFAESHDGIVVESHTTDTLTLTSNETVGGVVQRSEPETIPADLSVLREYLGY